MSSLTNDSDYNYIENIRVGVPVPDSNPVYNPNAPGAYSVFSVLPAPAAYDAPPQQQAPSLQSQTTAVPVPDVHAPVSNPAYNPNDPGGPTLKRSHMMKTICPHCHNECRTRTRTYPSCLTYTAAVATHMVSFWPLCWMPFVCDCCYQTDHFCSVCGNQVGLDSAGCD
jgi:hypothetical protein